MYAMFPMKLLKMPCVAIKRPSEFREKFRGRFDLINPFVHLLKSNGDGGLST